jgi:MarR family transcriptional regulator, 2-MHQ and catechol-resistance regulon repressor
MAPLGDEIGKRCPFDLPEQEAVLNLFRTSDRLQHRFARLFAEYDLTPSQYNVLRILRGEGRPLECMEIARRTITAVPGITGLIDRLERKRPPLVRRERCSEDRRVVHVAITPEGLELLGRLDGPIRELHRKVLEHFKPREVAELTRLLEKARQICEQEEPE